MRSCMALGVGALRRNRTLRLSDVEIAAHEAAAAGLSWGEWARGVLNDAAEVRVAQAVREEDARAVRERLRLTMRGVCPHGRSLGSCLDPSCKGVRGGWEAD